MAQAISGPRFVRLFVVICMIMLAVGALGVVPASALDDPYTTDCTLDSGTVCRVHFTDISQSVDYVLPDYVTSVDATVVGGTGSNSLTINEAPHTAKSISFTLIISEQLGHVISVHPGGIGSGPEPYSGGMGGFASFASRGQLWESCCLGYGAYGSVLHYGSDFVAGGTGSDEDLLSERGGKQFAWNEGTLTGPRGGVGRYRQCQDPNLGSSCQIVAWTEGSGGGGGVIGGGTGRPGVVMMDGYRQSGWAVPSGGGAGLSTTGLGISESTVQTFSGASGWVDIYYAKINRPSAPKISNLTYLSNGVSLDLVVPTTNGGTEVTNYEYSTDGGLTWAKVSPAQTSGPIVISGLFKGTTYSAKVRAVNAAGSGAASDAVSIKPVAPASAPTISGVVAGNGQATVSITAPSQINDSSLSGYDYSTNNGSTWSHFASVTGPFTITGLTNATAYQVKVRAVNSAGAGEASAAVTVNPTRLVPAKPVIASVVGGNDSATVNITTPTDVTAQSITGYHYSIDRGATYQSAVVSNGSFTISGLTNGVSTSVQIRATNFNGTSLASTAKSVIPATTPAAPSITTITPSAGALSIAFTAPNTGGSAITGYQYSLDGGLTWVVPKTAVRSSPIRVTGLPNVTTYQVSIRAVNAKGAGSASTAVSSTTPVLVPSAPVVTSISKTRTTITIDFDAPVNNGGGIITNYAYSTDRGRTWVVVSPASAATRVVIAGLNPSTLYPVQIAAINSAGRGASSALTGVGTLH